MRKKEFRKKKVKKLLKSLNVFCSGFNFKRHIKTGCDKNFSKVFLFFIFVIKILVWVQIRIGSVFSNSLNSDPDSAKYLNPDPDSSETLASIRTTGPDAN
jgi:hypothetical protein